MTLWRGPHTHILALSTRSPVSLSRAPDGTQVPCDITLQDDSFKKRNPFGFSIKIAWHISSASEFSSCPFLSPFILPLQSDLQTPEEKPLKKNMANSAYKSQQKSDNEMPSAFLGTLLSAVLRWCKTGTGTGAGTGRTGLVRLKRKKRK